MMLKVMQTNLEWFDKYLRPSAEPGVAKVGEIVTAAQDHEASNDEFIRAEMQKRNIPGAAVAVLRNGELLRAQGYGLANVELNVPVSTSTVFQLQSITKTFTAAATLMLVEQGAIRLDDKITQYLSDLPEAWHEITVRQLLSHTSGLKDFINEPTVNLRLDAAPAEIIKSLADKPLNFTPGEKFRYSNTGYQLLGMIIAKVSGKEWGTFLHETLFAPLGMTDTRVVVLNELVPNRAAGYLNIRGRLQNGNFIAPSILSYPGGGIQSTVVDLSKWAAALDTERLLKASTLEMMWTPARLSDGSTAPYGLGWFLGNYQDHRFVQHTGSHMTGFGTALTRFPDDRLSVIVLTNQNGSNSAEIANKLASRYFAPPVSPPAASGSAP
jgi:CubicO group peptidase (beta-lactamase class C family)